MMLRVSTLLVVYMCMVMVVRGSPLSWSNSHLFRTLQASGPTSSVFGPVAGVSAACKSTSVTLETNTTIIAANATVVLGGCINFDPNVNCQSTQCTCIETINADGNLTSLIGQQGGRVCTLNMQAVVTTTNNVNYTYNFVGFGGELFVGSACGATDYTAFLTYAFNTLSPQVIGATPNGKTLTGTVSACGSTYSSTATKKNGAGATASPQAAGLSLLFAAALMVLALL